MYLGLATTKLITPKKTAILHFKEDEDEKNNYHPAVSAPAANITENKSEYRLAIAAPGLERENFNIEIDQRVIFISAKCEKNIIDYNNDRCEYDYSDWTRAFSLPDDADTLLAHAKYRNGELLIRIPRGNTRENIAKASVCVY